MTVSSSNYRYSMHVNLGIANKWMIGNNNKSTEENKNFSKPSEHRQISRERVDKGNFFQNNIFEKKHSLRLQF